MAEEVEGVVNLHTECKIDEGKLELQYKVRKGKIEKSYGIEVAKMVGFPQVLIEEAENLLKLYENKGHHNAETMEIENKKSDYSPVTINTLTLLMHEMELKTSK